MKINQFIKHSLLLLVVTLGGMDQSWAMQPLRHQNEWGEQRGQNHHDRMGQVQQGMHPRVHQHQPGLQHMGDNPQTKFFRQDFTQAMGPNSQQRLSNLRQKQAERDRLVEQQFVDSSDDLIKKE